MVRTTGRRDRLQTRRWPLSDGFQRAPSRSPCRSPATGIPVVLLHGLTATRRYVVMGSTALERSGHHVDRLRRPRPRAIVSGGESAAHTGTTIWRPIWSRCWTRSASSEPCWPAPRWGLTRFSRSHCAHPARRRARRHHAGVRSAPDRAGPRVRAVGRAVGWTARRRCRRIRRRLRYAAGTGGDATDGPHRDPTAPIRPRASGRRRGCTPCRASLASVRVLRRPCRDRGSGDVVASGDDADPSIPSKSPSATRTRSRGCAPHGGARPIAARLAGEPSLEGDRAISRSRVEGPTHGFAARSHGSVLAVRLAAQRLSGATRADAVEAARHLLAIQAQDPRGARLAIRVRTDWSSCSAVDHALSVERSLIITWVNRGTLHLIARRTSLSACLTTPQLRRATTGV